MTDQNALARDYLAQLDSSIERLPRTLLMEELEAFGLNKDSPLMLLLEHAENEYLTIDELKDITRPAPMELTEADKGALAELLNPILPNQPVPISMWQPMLCNLELSHDHPFMEEVFSRPEDAEMTREQMHELATKHGLTLLPLKAPGASEVNHARQSVDKPDPASDGKKKDRSAEQAANTPTGEAGFDPGRNPAAKERRPSNPSGKRPPDLVPQGPFAGALSSLASALVNPFASSKQAYQESVPTSPTPGGLATGSESSLSAGSVVDQIGNLTEALKANKSPETVESLSRTIAMAGRLLDNDESMSARDRRSLTDALASVKRTVDSELSEEDKRSLGESLQEMIRELMDLLTKLFRRNREEDQESPSPA